jgi:hypothetical protein
MRLNVLPPQLRQLGEVVVGVVRHNARAPSGCLGLKCGRHNHATSLGSSQLRLVLWVVEETQRVALRSVERRESMYFKVGVANKAPS